VATGASGVPQALYTGVRLKGSTYDGAATRAYAPGEPMIESVMLSTSDADAGGDLEQWNSASVVIPEPPNIGASICSSAAASQPCCSVGLREWFTLYARLPAVPFPAAGKPLEGWRDPFIFQSPAGSGGGDYQMLLGSGFEDSSGRKCGCVLRYSTKKLEGPWMYEGILAEGHSGEGRVWECPAILQARSTHAVDMLKTGCSLGSVQQVCAQA
jgi:hypothetical protein